MKVIVLGYHNIGCICLEELLAQGEQVLAVFTHEDNPNENVWFRSVKELAQAHGVPTFTPPDINALEWVEKIRELKPDILFSFYYRNLVCQDLLDVPPMGCLNLHGSLLPKYRGRVPVNWAIIHGETETGVTLHYMVAKPDAGDIVAQRGVPIDFADTARTVFDKMTVAARELFHETLPLLREGRAPRLPQDLSQGSYFSGRKPEDGLIDWRWSALRIYNLVRAVTHPYPGAVTFLDGRKLFVWKCHPLSTIQRMGESAKAMQASHRIGEVVGVDEEKQAAFAQTGDGVLRLDSVQFEGEEEQAGSVLPVGAVMEGWSIGVLE
jgi:methionyl-tRNA formyltransferase